MKKRLQHITIHYSKDFNEVITVPLSYQLFGQPLHSAPVVLINHALTGNSNVSGEYGWWNKLVGDGKIIDTKTFTVICFNIPGNGYDGLLFDDHRIFSCRDIASIFLLGLQKLDIHRLYALVGGSIGGSIAWEMLAKSPNLTERFIPIASDYKTTDWLHSQCLVQQYLLESDDKPLEKARVHAMLCYRTPESINKRFQNQIDQDKKIRKSHDWLNYHGNVLNERFSIKSYRLMNHLLMNIDVKVEELWSIRAHIHLVAVNSDLFFPAFEINNTYQQLKSKHKDVSYDLIDSIHGHDAFLMEYEQLINILKPIFS